MITHKFTDEDISFGPVEPGVYPATIKDAQEEVSKAGGNEQIVLVWKLDNGHQIKDYLVFTDKTGYKIDSFLKSTGMAPAKGAEIEIDAAELVGKRAFIRVRTEEYNQRKKNKVAEYVTDRGIPEQPVEAENDALPMNDEKKKIADDDLPF